jgi:hypothetical protein
MMTKTELMQAIYRLTHGTGIVYEIIYVDDMFADPNESEDTKMTVHFTKLSDTPTDTTSSIGG